MNVKKVKQSWNPLAPVGRTRFDTSSYPNFRSPLQRWEDVLIDHNVHCNTPFKTLLEREQPLEQILPIIMSLIEKDGNTRGLFRFHHHQTFLQTATTRGYLIRQWSMSSISESQKGQRGEMILTPRRERFERVGSLFREPLQTQILTFRGIQEFHS